MSIEETQDWFHSQYCAYFHAMPRDGTTAIMEWVGECDKSALEKMVEAWQNGKLPDKKPLLGQLKREYIAANMQVYREARPREQCHACKSTGTVYLCMGGESINKMKVLYAAAAVPLTYYNTVPCKCTIGQHVNSNLAEPYSREMIERLNQNSFRFQFEADEFGLKCTELWKKEQLDKELAKRHRQFMDKATKKQTYPH